MRYIDTQQLAVVLIPFADLADNVDGGNGFGYYGLYIGGNKNDLQRYGARFWCPVGREIPQNEWVPPECVLLHDAEPGNDRRGGLVLQQQAGRRRCS